MVATHGEKMQPSGRGYDHGITTFSPDGRLFQVEYARESVKRGTTTAGLKYRNGVVLVVDKRIASRLIIPESIEKVFKIDENIGFATSGLVADARQLVARARIESQINRITYAATVPVDILTKKICDFKNFRMLVRITPGFHINPPVAQFSLPVH